jgi:hypothetical protein
MASLSDITTGIQTVTTAGAVTGSLNISGITGAYTLCLEVFELTSGGEARIQFEDSVNAFTNVIPVAVFDVPGQIGQASWTQGNYNPLTYKKSIRSSEIPGCRAGAANAVLRVNVTSITGASPSLTLHAWLEQ